MYTVRMFLGWVFVICLVAVLVIGAGSAIVLASTAGSRQCPTCGGRHGVHAPTCPVRPSR